MNTGQPTEGRGTCAAKTRSGGHCKKPAGWGTEHTGTGRCKLHGGSTRNHMVAAAKEQIRQTVATLGLRVETTPAEALLNEIYETAGNVEFYRSLVQELPTHPEGDVYVKYEHGEGGHWERGEPGVYGRTYHQSGVPTGEAKPHVLVQLYNDERKHLAAITVAALKVGIAEQLVQIASKQAESIAQGFRDFAIALGHDPSSPEVREAFRAQLTVLAGGRAA